MTVQPFLQVDLKKNITIKIYVFFFTWLMFINNSNNQVDKLYGTIVF